MSNYADKWKRSRWQTLTLLAALSASGWSYADKTEVKLYRYTNDQGVKVLGHTLPPQYAQQGYEVLSTKGQVLEVVPAALSKDQIENQAEEQKLREDYISLRKRYSNVDDIERAKNRRLENINTNISIIRGNIGSLNTRIENLMMRAASLERAGKGIPQNLLSELSDLRAEKAVAQSSLENRLNDYRKTSDRFKHEILTFHRGSELLEKNAQVN